MVVAVKFAAIEGSRVTKSTGVAVTSDNVITTIKIIAIFTVLLLLLLSLLGAMLPSLLMPSFFSLRMEREDFNAFEA